MGKIYTQLSIEERTMIQTQLSMGFKPGEIARMLGRSASTLSRELNRHGWARPKAPRGVGRPLVTGGYRADVALPVPGGAAIGQALAAVIGAPDAKPESILAALSQNAEAVQKARDFEQTHQETLLRIATDAEIRAIEAVNKTMQAEAASDHWPTYSWRPFIGFMFGGYLASMFLLPMLGRQPVPLSPDLTLAVGGVLGIASYFRGKMQADPGVPTDNRG